jgi:amino acid transporter
MILYGTFELTVYMAKSRVNNNKIIYKKIKLVDRDDFIPEESAAHDPDSLTEHGHRPRNLGVLESLFHLDADWGTSLAYVLPLALAFTGRLAPIYLMIIAFIMFVVANGYKVVCRHNPDGGGVYSSLRKINKFLAVCGALLLVTDYIVTQALSITDAFHYIQIDMHLKTGFLKFLPEFIKNSAPKIWTVFIIIILTLINWRGAHFSAKFAGLVSGPTFFLAGFLTILALPLVPAGLANIGNFNQSIFDVLKNTTYVLLALSGVESISNMTGVMKDPEKTSKKTINLELLKVVFTTVILGIAMNGVPNKVVYVNHIQAHDTKFTYEVESRERTDFVCEANKFVRGLVGEKYNCEKIIVNKTRPNILTSMSEYLLPGKIGQIYGLLIGLIYGLLLIFAGNTALIGITNVTYALARDNELPVVYTKLNKKYGVPIWGLVTAGIAPILTVLVIGANVEALASLYAIGVVGAVTLNLSGTALQVKGRERLITAFGGLLMGTLFIALVFNKMEATFFAFIILTVGLTVRAIQKYVMKYIVGGIEPWLKTGKAITVAKGQIFLPVYDEYDPTLFEFAGSFALKNNKIVVMLYLHEVNTIMEANPKKIKLATDTTDFLRNAKLALEKTGTQAHVMYDFTDDIGATIYHYRQAIKPSTTIITPHKQSILVDFLSGSIIKKIIKPGPGNILIYSGD